MMREISLDEALRIIQNERAEKIIIETPKRKIMLEQSYFGKITVSEEPKDIVKVGDLYAPV